VPDDIRAAWDARARGGDAESEWWTKFEAYRAAHPSEAIELERRMTGAMPDGWSDTSWQNVLKLQDEAGDVATRKSSQIALDAFGPMLPELIGGSADLAGSNNTIWAGSVDVLDGTGDGNYVYFGVREFAMTAICNGLGLHGGFVPYNATFLVFSDYARNAVRMSALIPAHNIHIYTHDSIGLGEDGPTHQPVEHVASLRLIPNLSVWRPCDTVETAVAWKTALEERHAPHALVLTRQGLPKQARDAATVRAIEKGGYVLRDTDDTPDAVIMATGSEVKLAIAAAERLAAEGIAARVVSMPNTGRFLAQDAAYRQEVLPPDVTARVAVEAGVTACWQGFVGDRGRVLGIDRFGASAPGDVLFEHYGLTVDAVCDAVRATLNTD
jgi:transketolase